LYSCIIGNMISVRHLYRTGVSFWILLLPGFSSQSQCRCSSESYVTW
jgi:hypothetical protein